MKFNWDVKVLHFGKSNRGRIFRLNDRNLERVVDPEGSKDTNA